MVSAVKPRQPGGGICQESVGWNAQEVRLEETQQAHAIRQFHARSMAVVAGHMVEAYGDLDKGVVKETQPALELIGGFLADLELTSVHWLLDSPVSNSGRLATKMRSIADQNGWPWNVELVPDPDMRLRSSQRIIASADSVILDNCSQWVNLAKLVVDDKVQKATTVPMCPRQ